MKLLDRYIFFQFLTTYLFTVLILVLVICVIDYSEKSDDFIKNVVPLSEILFDYYINFILHLATLITPLLVFIATVFVTARLAGRTEWIAMLSSGVSFRRLLVPYFAGAALIGICSFYLGGWVVPNANKARIAFEVRYIKKPYSFDERNFHSRVGENVYAYMQSYNNQTHTGRYFSLEKIINHQIIEKLQADVITWDTARKSWHLENYVIHYFDGEKEMLKEGRDLDTLIALQPKDFESKHRYYETLTFSELENYINTQQQRGRIQDLGIYYVEKFQRYASPFSILVLTLLGVSVSSRKTRQGTSFQIALGFVLAFVFLIFVIISRSLGQSGSYPPEIVAFLPNVTFGLVAFYLYKKAPK
jgi:lipopolysaccharide export system permease protein